MRTWLILIFVCGHHLVSDVCAQTNHGKVTIWPTNYLSRFCRKDSASDLRVRCVTGSICKESGGCDCQPGTFGDAGFQCYNQGDKFVQVVGNVLSSNLRKPVQDVPIAWPCNHRLVRLQTSGLGDIDSCYMEITGLNKPFHKRILLHGVKIYLEYKYKDGDSLKITTRIQASVMNHIYKFEEWTKAGKDEHVISKRQVEDSSDLLDGSGSGFAIRSTKPVSRIARDVRDVRDTYFDDEDFVEMRREQMPPDVEAPLWLPSKGITLRDGSVYRFQVDADNFAVLKLEPCGVVMKLRPFHPDTQDEEKSGFSLAVNESHVLPTLPESNPGLKTFEDALTEDMSPTTSAKEHLFRRGIEQLVDDDMWENSGRQCITTKDLYERSKEMVNSKLSDAFEKCYILFKNNDLVQCVELFPELDNFSLRIFDHCLKAVLYQSSASCSLMQADLNKRKCSRWFWDNYIIKANICSNTLTVKSERVIQT